MNDPPRRAHSPRPHLQLRNGRSLPGLLLISTAVFILDRLAKRWVVAHLAYGASVPLIPQVLHVSHWTNQGAAFSMFANSPTPHLVDHILIGIICTVAALVFVALVYLGSRFNMITVSLALVLGGALGNVYDRIVYGAVIDFLDFQVFGFHCPDFNIADASVVVGVCLLVLESLITGKAHPPQKHPSKPMRIA